MIMRMKLFVCVVLVLCPACKSIRRDSQYNNRPKAAVATTASAEIANLISISFSHCVIYDTKISSLRQDSDSITKESTEQY